MRNSRSPKRKSLAQFERLMMISLFWMIPALQQQVIVFSHLPSNFLAFHRSICSNLRSLGSKHKVTKESQTPQNQDSGTESESSDDGEAQQEVLKQIKFPDVERDQQPANMVNAVCRCIAKQVDKTDDSISKLEKIEKKSEIQKK